MANWAPFTSAATDFTRPSVEKPGFFCNDISDGLVSDLNHILKASGCGARINLDALPQSEALKQSCVLSKGVYGL